jgi:hypothetical protein
MIKKISLVIVIIIIAVGVYALLVLFQDKGDGTGQTSQASPTPFPTLRPQAVKLKKELTKTDKVSGNLDFETGPDFEVTYLISNDQFLVRINKTPYPETKKKAEEWFAGKGFSPTDLCELYITFVAAINITESGGSYNPLPSGCPSPLNR